MENTHRRNKGMDKFCLCDCSYVRKQIEDEEKRKDVKWIDEILPSSTDTKMHTLLKRSYSVFSFNSSDSSISDDDSSKSSEGAIYNFLQDYFLVKEEQKVI